MFIDSVSVFLRKQKVYRRTVGRGGGGGEGHKLIRPDFRMGV